MPSRRLVAGAGVAVLALAAVVQAVRYYRWGLAYVHPTRKLPTAAELDRAHRLASDVSYTTRDGVLLRADYVPPKNGVVVVAAHGLFENRMHYLSDAEMLARHGYGMLYFDSRAHGESGGDVATWGQQEQLDVEAGVTYALAHGATKVATLGFSVGTTAVVLEAAHDPRVGAIIVEALWPSLSEELRNKASKLGAFSRAPFELAYRRAGIDIPRVSPIDVLPALAGRPKLFLAGAEDEDTPVPIMQRVFDAAPEPKQMWIVPGAHHEAFADVAPAEYERVLIGFLDRAFHVT